MNVGAACDDYRRTGFTEPCPEPAVVTHRGMNLCALHARLRGAPGVLAYPESAGMTCAVCRKEGDLIPVATRWYHRNCYGYSNPDPRAGRYTIRKVVAVLADGSDKPDMVTWYDGIEDDESLTGGVLWGLYEDGPPDDLPMWIADCADEGVAMSLLAALDLADRAHEYLVSKRAWDAQTGMGDKDVYLRFFRAMQALEGAQ